MIKAVTDITIDTNICFPSYTPDPLDLAPDELNQDVRTDFHNLPFQFIVPGYSNAHQGQQYLHVNHSFLFQELRFSTFQKKCPKGGPLIGPVEPKSPHQHFCFVNHIMGHLVQSFNNTPSIPGHFFTVPCKTRCPEDAPTPPTSSILSTSTSSSLLMMASSGSGASLSSFTSAVPQYHNSKHSASPSTGIIMLSGNALAGRVPWYLSRDCSVSPRPLQQGRHQRTPSPSSESLILQCAPASASNIHLQPTLSPISPTLHLLPDVMPDRLSGSATPLISFCAGNIHDLFDLSQAIHSSADQAYSDSTLCIEANTITNAANGMINVFQHYYMWLSKGNAFDSDALNFTNPDLHDTFSIYRWESLVKHDLTVGDMKSIFSIPVWHFQA
ncbi:uncharacterized protein EDB93DRAFT_1246224 [Suillus bovinus]|uniref:uncharacterized protein n=1 Tax=Suillus bovinus TaxID=48563 RepID=UPI001B85B967|nr:uncharacterized protein EDB93DRAFT_1246224 [Suillus bovinus]KAG2158375.1 hypothetical protein EDB93DRAFT_1246224 [Suillus bovinus]